MLFTKKNQLGEHKIVDPMVLEHVWSGDYWKTISNGDNKHVTSLAVSLTVVVFWTLDYTT